MGQLGTIRLQTQNSGTVSVPVFDTGDSGNGVYEFVRVQTDSGTGFIPVTSTGQAKYHFLRVQSQNNGIVAVTDSVSTIPDSAVLRWTFDNDDTSSGTALDVWNNNDGTINGATTGVAGANQTYTTNEAYSFDDSFDGSEDDVDLGTALLSTTDDTQPYSIAVWVKTPAPNSGQPFVNQYSSSNTDGRRFTFRFNDDGSGTIQWFKGGMSSYPETTQTFSADTWYHIVGVKTAAQDVILYVDGSEDSTHTDGDTYAFRDLPFRVANRENSYYFEGTIDDLRVYDKALSSTEVSNLYNTGSISG